jgi:hypothetical protein
MKRPAIATMLLAMALTSAGLQAAEEGEQLKAPEASIPFVNLSSSIRDWEADGTGGLWVQDGHRDWYYAKLMGPCIGLDFAMRVGFDVRGIDRLDRFATVVVPEHGRCSIASFTKSEGPPDSKRKQGGNPDSSYSL